MRRFRDNDDINCHADHSNSANLANLPAAGFPVPNTAITLAVDMPAANGLPQRCIGDGVINQHTSPVDHCQYVNAFQVQLPANWNGRFMFQGGRMARKGRCLPLQEQR